ncbi:UvrD-helicase domain-containing protein, partial [Desulfoprunum benzoelyticum]
MPREMTTFDCAEVRLHRGSSLVEASAGTGKTYAIAMLVLRLVVEEGVPLERLLVVTFTKAATAELRERIRKRLLEARDLLRGQTNAADLTLSSWASGIGDRGPALERLGLALGDIDRAAVFTIHGFCQRMLQEQALESSQLFQVDLVPDTASTRQQVVDDFWRRSMYGLSDLACAVLLDDFATPAALDATLGPMDGTIAGVEPACPSPAEAAVRLEGIQERLRSWWFLHRDRLAALLADAIAAGYFVAELAHGFPQWWRQLEALFGSGRPAAVPEMSWLGRTGLVKMLNGRRLRDDGKKLAFLRDWPLADELAADWQDAAAGLRLALRASLAEELRTEVERRVRERGAMSYNDLILRLASALTGPAGKRLRSVLGDRYDAALIDEFQDTDAAQWQIFSALFGGGSHALYLIGDPKQAIYRFRGADIHSYFAARKRADRLLTLDRNFRSHPQLVAAVNELFAGRQPFAFDEAIMPYHPVTAAKTAADGSLCRGGAFLAPMRYCHLPAPAEGGDRWSSGKAMARIQEFVVDEIDALLRGQAAAQIQAEAGARPLAPGDIAILVRSHRQAASYQKALLQRAIPAVIASRQSIFATVECDDLLRLLQAVDEPGDLRLLKAAMTSPWFGLDGPRLQAIWQDEGAFDHWRLQFQKYHQLWRNQGLLTMMSALLREEEVFVRLAAQPAAERRIANIAHLLEVLQEKAAADNLGPYQTLQWLQAMWA